MIVLPEAVDKNLEVLGVILGQSKNRIVEDAVKQFLIAHGLQPDKMPVVSVGYGNKSNVSKNG